MVKCHQLKKAGIQKGDSLLEIEGHDISSLDSTSELLIDLLEKQDTDSIEVIIERSGKEKSKTIDPRYCLNLNEYGIGLYLTDSSLGVGTLTYKDFENKEYGALGHSISTWDSAPASLKDGRIVDARIIDINKGSDGKPGEKKGNFLHGEEPLGTIEKNTKHGIFGKITNESVYSSQIEPKSIGLAKHAEPGSAQILTVLDNQEIERFEIEIKRVFPHNAENGKGMVIEVTDEELLQRTGGIVQGMSGSPIIQDDKLIGAITHVFVNDSEKGYGTFLEWMLYESEK
ncbi:SpoIVB peptidase [Natranaerobius thermophilus]|uniref:SpoIVB peptidase n=1 Tax=Natranaerobius thermophilus TaxID=375929 RepID=UPI002F4148BE